MGLLGFFIAFCKNPMLRRFAWGSMGGSITGLQNFLKDGLTIVKATEEGPFPWILYLFLGLAGGSAFLGLLFLTACMKRYDATYSAASFVGSFVVSASIMSAAHYDTFQSLEKVSNYVLYPVGLVVLMVGVYLLVRESEDASDNSGPRDLPEPVRKGTGDSQVRTTLLSCTK